MLWKSVTGCCTNAVIGAREHGSTKLISSKLCAQSLVRQMFHMSEIEPYTGPKPKIGIDTVSSVFLLFFAFFLFFLLPS